MRTIVTITIENPTEEILKALLQGSAEKQSAVIRTSVKVEKSKSNSLKGKTPVTKQKKCVVCGKPFTPHSNRQIKCSVICGMKPHKLEPVDKTLVAIEKERKQRESKPYEFLKNGSN